jgi:hypothetical protein
MESESSGAGGLVSIKKDAAIPMRNGKKTPLVFEP